MSNNSEHGVYTNPVRVWVPIHTVGPVGKGKRCHKYPILDEAPTVQPDDRRIAYIECVESDGLTKIL